MSFLHRIPFGEGVAVRALLLVVCVLLCGQTTSLAQGSGDDVQRTLNQEGLDALKAGDSERAAKLFRAAIEVGELDLLYLNLGRALQKSGRCMEAEKMFGLVMGAPPVGTPPHEVVMDTANEYRAELRQSCGGLVVVSCKPAQLSLTIDGMQQSCGVEISVPLGTHIFEGRHEGRVATVEVEVGSPGLEKVQVEVPAAQTAVAEPETDVPVAGNAAVTRDPPPSRWQSTAGWTLVGVGGASLLAGAVFSLLTAQVNNDIKEIATDRREGVFDAGKADDLKSDASTYGVLQFVGYGAGVLMGAAGVVFLLLDDESGAQARLVPAFAPDMPAGVLLEGRF